MVILGLFLPYLNLIPIPFSLFIFSLFLVLYLMAQDLKNLLLLELPIILHKPISNSLDLIIIPFPFVICWLGFYHIGVDFLTPTDLLITASQLFPFYYLWNHQIKVKILLWLLKILSCIFLIIIWLVLLSFGSLGIFLIVL